MKWIIISITIAFLMMSCEGSTQIIPVEKGVSKQLADYRDEVIDDVIYELSFDIPEEKSNEIEASLDMRFELSEISQALQLDFRADSSQLKRIDLNGENIPITFKEDHILLPASQLRKGANQVKINFIAGDLSLNRKDEFLYTLLVPDRAATLFPCFDQPNVKAKYQLELVLPSSWTALANGSLIKQEVRGNRKLMQFKETALIPTYLFAFTAGRFQELTTNVDGQSMKMLYRESDTLKVANNEEAIFKLHLDAIKWMEDYTDIPMPFEKFDFALIPGFQYGGMEHPGAIFYRESSLMLDENATENQQLSRASLIAHETAHMWFGDLVTMDWFDDVWLKEVFANFMAAKIVNPAFPETNHDLNFLLRHQPSAYGEDRSLGSHPIQQPLDNLNEAGTLYGRIIYQKAPVVMRQLEAKTGASNLKDGLRTYLQEFAFDNATWDDLIRILDDKTTEDLEQWSKVWVKSAGMPVFETNILITAAAGKNSIRFTQEAQDSKFWSEQTTIALFYPDTIILFDQDLLAEETSATITLDATMPLAVLPNASSMSYGYFPLDKQSQSYFLQQVNSVADPLLRGAIWIALYEDFLNKNIGLEPFFTSVLESIPVERNRLNRSYLLQTLERLYWRFLNSQQREQYSVQVENIMEKAYLNATTGGEQTAFFRTYYKTALSDEVLVKLRAIWEQQQITPDLPLTESESIDLMAELALRTPKESSYLINTQMKRTENKDRRERLGFICGSLLYNHSARDAFFDGFKHPENRGTEPWVVAAAAYLNHPLHYPYSEDYLQRSLELMQEIQATGDIFFPRQFITAVLSGHQSAKAAKIVEDFLSERPDYPPRLRNKILMAADLLFKTRYE